MKLRHKVAAILLIATMVVGGESETRRAFAQDAPPDLRMLMNLDLFEPRHNAGNGAPASAASPADDSLFDQIRALNSMGYLGNQQGGGNGASAPRAAMRAPQSPPPPESVEPPPPQSDINEPDEASKPAPNSQPSYDVEGPLP